MRAKDGAQPPASSSKDALEKNSSNPSHTRNRPAHQDTAAIASKERKEEKND
jgi:hypothetical protein